MCDSVRTKKTVRFTGVSELGEGGGGSVRTAEFHCTLKAVELNSRNILKKMWIVRHWLVAKIISLVEDTV